MNGKGVTVCAAMALAGMLLADSGRFAGAQTVSVTFTQIGSPVWTPVDGELFSAPIGTSAAGFAGFTTTQTGILPPPNHALNAALGEIVPGAPHAGPYDHEISNSVTAQGFVRGPNFTSLDFSNGNAVWVAFNVIPGAGAPTGKTPDYDSGPVIPNSVFPIALSGDTTRNGAEFDPNWGGTTPDVNTILGLSTATYDGYSSFPFFDAEALEFGPGGVTAAGSYDSKWRYLDSTGAGWQVETQYTVSDTVSAVPLPSALYMALPIFAGVAVMPFAMKRRRAAKIG